MSKKYTQEEIQCKLREIFDDQFDIIGPYTDTQTKVAIRCNHCGNIIYKKPSKMVTKAHEGCYICSGKNWFKTTETFKAEVETKYPGDYDIIGEYIKAREPILVKRIKCGHTYKVSPDNLLRGKGCPYCSPQQSHYMDDVEAALDEMGVEYQKEKRFFDCMDVRVLPFDYFLPAYGCVIEVDGEYHYRARPHNDDSESALERVKKHDEMKTNYCLSRGIPLLRLPYFCVENFEQMITEFLQANTEVTA